jgi:hypothetical protein
VDKESFIPDFGNGRRFFIKKSLLGIGVMTLGGFLSPGTARKTEPVFKHGELHFFDNEESEVVSLIVRSLISAKYASPEDIRDVVIRLDRYFEEAYPEDQSEFRRLLVVFNNPIFVLFFSGYLKSFTSMSDIQREEYLYSWMTSAWGFRRTAFQALKRLCMSMHYTRDSSWRHIGYAGPLL